MVAHSERRFDTTDWFSRTLGDNGKAKIAPYWRIRTGIRQSDTSLSTEVNLALALRAYDSKINVDFETVWGQFHTKAERVGDSTANFIEWARAVAK